MVAMRGANKQRGFTIIEVSLFLAITGLMIATLVFGMQRMISQVRFNDSINSLTAYMQSQYEEVRSGINPRDVGVNICNTSSTESAPGSTNCLLIGKVLHFNQSSSVVETAYVVAKNVPALEELSGLSDQAALLKTTLVAETSETTQDIQWGATFERGTTYGSAASFSPTDVNTLAIMRSPISSQVMVFAFNAPDDSAFNDLKAKLAGAGDAVDTLNQSSVYLIKSPEAYGLRSAGICVEPGSVGSSVHSVMPLGLTANNAEIVAACGK